MRIVFAWTASVKLDAGGAAIAAGAQESLGLLGGAKLGLDLDLDWCGAEMGEVIVVVHVP